MGSIRTRKRASFPKAVGKGVGKGLGKLATGAVNGVVGTLAEIVTLGLFRKRRRR